VLLSVGRLVERIVAQNAETAPQRERDAFALRTQRGLNAAVIAEIQALLAAAGHMRCVFLLPYSNLRCASVCLSESIASLRHGVQRALFQLGRAPEWHQIDNSTPATHRIPDGKSVGGEGRGSTRTTSRSYSTSG